MFIFGALLALVSFLIDSPVPQDDLARIFGQQTTATDNRSVHYRTENVGR